MTKILQLIDLTTGALEIARLEFKNPVLIKV